MQIHRVYIPSIRMFEKDIKMKKLESELPGRVCYDFKSQYQRAASKSSLHDFRKVSGGLSLGWLSKWLQNKSITSPSGKETWARAGIDKIPSNRSYALPPVSSFYKAML